jgi:glycosyltransferase involved in cell wall biosynthesis
MIFKFLKYVKPTSYFTLKNINKEYIYPDVSDIPDHIYNLLKLDSNYITDHAQKLDLAYQAIEKGFIGNSKKLISIENIHLKDEYVFLKKYFSFFWYIHTFLWRLITFHNPVKEFTAFLYGFKSNSHSYDDCIPHTEFDEFHSSLIDDLPKVSVIIPTLNRYKLLKDVLKDLEKQKYQNFDVIIVDQSEPFHKSSYNDFNLDIKLIHQEDKALWLARNTAINISKSEYLLFFDDDSRVNEDWILSHLKCLDLFNADISSGVSISKLGDSIPKNYSYFKYSDQLDTGNVLIKREVFKKINLFDRQFEKQRMGDGEFGLRAYKYGFINISNPRAKRLHLKAQTGGLRVMGLWDGFRSKRFTDPRPIPSVLYLYRKYFGNKMTYNKLVISIPSSIIPYKYKGSKLARFLSYFLSVILFPILFFQIIKSWDLSTKKIREGSFFK